MQLNSAGTKTLTLGNNGGTSSVYGLLGVGAKGDTGATGAKGDKGDTGAPGGSDASFAGWINDTTPSATRAALNASLVPKWQPSTAYTAGQIVMAPDGGLVERLTDGTSGTTYTATNWKTATGLTNTFARLSGVQAVATSDAALVPMKHNPVDATSGNRTMTLDAATSAGQMIAVSKKDASVNTVTISAAHLRDGGAGSIVLVGQYEAITFISKADGSWWPIGDHRTKAWFDKKFRASAAELMPMYGFGHSYMSGGAGADTGTRMLDRLAKRLSTLTSVNYGLPGKRMDQILSDPTSGVATVWTPNNRGLCVILDGVVNDAKAWPTGTADTTREAFRSILTYLSAMAVLGPASNALVFGPGWTNGTASAAGSYLDVSFTGDACDILVSYVTGAGATATVKNSGTGTTVTTINTGGYQSAASGFTGAVRLQGYGTGDHTVRITLTSGTLTVVGVAIPSLNPPSILWLRAGPFIDTTQVLTALTTFQDACATIAAGFPNVITANAAPVWDTSTMLGPDQLHPNDYGNWTLANLAEDAIRTLTFRQGLNQLTGPNAGTYTAVLPTYSTSGATAPAQVTGLTAVTGNQVNLAWATPTDGGATLGNYALQYKLTSDSTWTTYSASVISPKATSVTIPSGLTSGSSYDFRIAATNAVGQGTYSATASATVGDPVMTYASDDFNRADGAPGSTPVGSYAWASGNQGTGLVIVSNQLKAASAVGDLYVNDTHANGTIQVTLPLTNRSQGVAFRRATDGSHYLLYQDTGSFVGYRLSRRAASGGGYTTIATYSTTAAANNDTIKVVLNGSTMTFYLNGVQIGTTTQTINQTETQHGVWAGGVNAVFDNWSHTSLVA